MVMDLRSERYHRHNCNAIRDFVSGLEARYELTKLKPCGS